MAQVSYEQLNAIRKKALYSNVVYYGFIGGMIFLYSSFFWLSEFWLRLIHPDNLGYAWYGMFGFFVIGLFVLRPRSDKAKKEAKKAFFESLIPLLTHPVSLGSTHPIFSLVQTSGLFDYFSSGLADDRYSTSIAGKEVVFSHLILKRSRPTSNNPQRKEHVFNGFFAAIPTDLSPDYHATASYNKGIGFVLLVNLEEVSNLPNWFTENYHTMTTNQEFGQEVFTIERMNVLHELYQAGYKVKFSVYEGKIFLAFPTKNNLFDPSFSKEWTPSTLYESAQELNTFLELLHNLK